MWGYAFYNVKNKANSVLRNTPYLYKNFKTDAYLAAICVVFSLVLTNKCIKF